MKKIKAIGLFSGGLDSLLACRVLIEQGIEVMPVKFDTGFFFNMSDRKTHLEKKSLVDSKIEYIDVGDGIKVPLNKIYIADEYLSVLLHPRFGYGKAINPCIDCHLYFINKAKEIMEEKGAHFVFTGEVVGQRPMSQHLQTLKRIEKNSNIEGLLLRPLSAKVLPVTLVEEKGWVDRGKLFGISGRSRKIQIELAEKFGISKYQQPAGGCILTEENYSVRMRDLLDHNSWQEPAWDEIDLISGGRIFRLSDKTKIIVGRSEKDNEFLENYCDRFPYLEVEVYGSPITIIHGEISPDVLDLAAQITVAYSGAPKDIPVKVKFTKPGKEDEILTAQAIDKKITLKWKIG
ncbi:MAG: hypothetical protein KAR38_10460 [Calditrichia bacterium]|nr:hypothetical protein [Calditrichia bacterium]